MFFLFSEEAQVHLRIQLQSDSDSFIPQENLDAAVTFGVEKIDATEKNKYVVAFLKKLLLQRQKLENKLLGNFLSPEIAKLWQDVLSSLEKRNGKVINIQSGSLIFTLVYPTRDFRIQLQDENWKFEIQRKLTELIELLGR